MIPIGSLFNVFYMDVLNDVKFQDVSFTSASGSLFSVNRSVLASASQMCCDFMLDLNNFANAGDDHVHISTNFSNDELRSLMEFLTCGSLPSDDVSKQLDVSKANIFAAIGIDLLYVSTGVRNPSNRSNLEPCHIAMQPEVKLKQEDVKSEPSEDGDCQEYMPGSDDGEDEEEKKPLVKMRKATKAKKRKAPVTKEDNDSVDKPPEAKRSKPVDFFHFPQDGARELDLFKYHCRQCIRGFKDLDDYRQHFLRHRYEKADYERPYTCLRCFHFRGKFSELEKHMRESECKDGRYNDADSTITYFCAFCPGEGTIHQTVDEFNKHLQVGSLLILASTFKRSAALPGVLDVDKQLLVGQRTQLKGNGYFKQC